MPCRRSGLSLGGRAPCRRSLLANRTAMREHADRPTDRRFPFHEQIYNPWRQPRDSWTAP